MDNLGNVLAVMAAVVVAGCLAWGAVVVFRERRASRRFAEQLDVRPRPEEQAALDRVRRALDELRHDVELWERGGQP